MDEFRDWVSERGGMILILLLAAFSGAWWWQGRPVAQPAGVLAMAEPLQTDPDSLLPWTFKTHQITPLAHFEIRARVLSRERYRFDRAAELSPVDFALGWGPMSDSRVLETIRIQQRDRWYFWNAERLAIPSAEVTTHSANMHMIPATEAVRNRLLSVRVGQLLALRGQLVRADGKDGWHWISSLSRADTGDGSCEVIWVESVSATDR